MALQCTGGIFDLDGTLYFGSDLGREIGRTAYRYMAGIKGTDEAAARQMVRSTRMKISEEQGIEASLSITCMALGGDLQELHRSFSDSIEPERFLKRDDRVVALLERLSVCFPLYIYTNNNRSLAARIMDTIGVSHLFRRVFTIEESWRPKPHRETLEMIFAETGLVPEETLFVGDRYDIDLRLPQEMGATVRLVASLDDLLALESLCVRD